MEPEVIKEEVVVEAPPTEAVVEPQQEATPSEEVVETPTQEVKPEVRDNRPIENVAWETKRKIDELYPKVDKIFELIQQQGQHQPQQPTYTKAQLQAYASDSSTTTEQRLWAYTEVDKLEKKEREQDYERLVKTTQTKSEADTRRSQSANWVATTFPDTVVKDNTGNVVGWNQSSPILMRANEYIARSETLRNDPEGFMAAVKMAAFDLGVSPSGTKKIDRTVAQLRKEQKKQLASSGGTRIAETPESTKQVKVEKLKDAYSKTGNRDAFNELLKATGRNPFAQ